MAQLGKTAISRLQLGATGAMGTDHVMVLERWEVQKAV